MDFSKAYNRQELTSFLANKFLPEDFTRCEENVPIITKTQYTQRVTRLGHCPSLDLVVYEVRHNSLHDARVGLSREAFRLLADEMEDKAIVAFVPEDNNSNYRLSLIEITLNWDESKVVRSYSNPRRYSYYLGEGIATFTPNKYLNEKGRIAGDEDLHSRFSVEVLTKEFYRELSAWYAWAVKVVRFPNDISTTDDDQKLNNEGVIRLITRLIFVWFLKQRGLIPWQFFDEDYIRENLLENFNPNVKVDLFTKSTESRYYKAILQNLFFAMLNCPIKREGSNDLTERKFKDGRSGYDDNKLMRYRSMFKDPELFLQLANETVPFLNGGLFDCLDEKDKGMYYDGFSERKDSMEQLCVPDYLFFGENVGKDLDLSGWYGDTKMKKVDVRGIILILKTYNFTVEENMPFDKDVSLDPELLGKAFENLLAEYNPETQSTARKQTGSFYTPREIVQYMVDESLVAHLKRTVGDSLEGEYRKLLSYTDDEVNLTDEQRTQIMQSLYRCKILDPACGSGAFPVGILQQMVHILTQIDPDNSRWKDMLMDQAISETSEAYRTASPEERAEMVGDIERSFDENVNRPDYARKLYLIENCIFGVDIQAIAIQISKLRFFISLVVDQKINNNPADNFGIRPLPNLEAKFVAANTLIGLKRAKANIFDSEEIKRKEKEMKAAKHRIFSARTYRTKKKYRDQVETLRQEIADLLVANNMIGNEQAQQLALWDMFDQNASSPFFDPEWMFGVKDGFDIVIGNPPYVDSELMTKVMPGMREIYAKLYKSAKGNWDMYVIFYDKAMNLLNKNGFLIYITPNKWLSIGYGKQLRNMYFRNVWSIADCRRVKVFEAGNEPIVCGLTKCNSNTIRVSYFVSNFKAIEISKISKNHISQDNLGICLSTNLTLLVKIKTQQSIVSDFAIVENPFATSEAYDLIPLIEEYSSQTDFYKLLTTGSIDPYINFWGTHITPYLKHKYGYPIVDKTSFAMQFPRRVRQASSPKLILSGMRYFEAFYDTNGDYLAGKSTIIILPKEKGEDLSIMLAILNSKLISFYIKESFSTLGIGGGINFSADMVADIPLPSLHDVNCIRDLVVDISIKKEQDKNADTSAEEQEIDRLVYKLYGLTYDEVLTVDPNTPITEEEYNKE